MPERPAAKPRPKSQAPAADPVPAPAGVDSSLPVQLPDLEFTRSDLGVAPPPAAVTVPDESRFEARALTNDDFAIDDFDEADFTESSVMAVGVDLDEDPLQACVEQVVVLYANGQDATARSLLETFVRAYHGLEGKRFWLLLFDLLQNAGDQAAFEKLGVDYAQCCETSPPTWRSQLAPVDERVDAAGPRKVFLQGVVTQDGLLPVNELARIVAAGESAIVDCSKLVGCDDVAAGQLAELLLRARKRRLSVALMSVEAFMARLDGRLVAGEQKHEPAWLLLLELLQRHGTQEKFEERAVDYAVTFECSPPSWETPPAAPKSLVTAARPADGARYFSGELKGCRFEDLLPIVDDSEQVILDFSGVSRLDFVSAGQLVNRLTPLKAMGKDVIIRSPNHLVAELMAVVGLNKQARILVPKS